MVAGNCPPAVAAKLAVEQVGEVAIQQRHAVRVVAQQITCHQHLGHALRHVGPHAGPLQQVCRPCLQRCCAEGFQSRGRHQAHRTPTNPRTLAVRRDRDAAGRRFLGQRSRRGEVVEARLAVIAR